MKILLSLILTFALAAQDKPADPPKPPPPTVAQLQQTVDAQVKLIDWLKQKLDAITAQMNAQGQYLQAVLAVQALEMRKPPEPVKPEKK